MITPSLHPQTLCNMDDLPNHLVFLVATKVSNSSIKNFFIFRAISPRYWRLLNQLEVLRALLNIPYRFGLIAIPTAKSRCGGSYKGLRCSSPLWIKWGQVLFFMILAVLAESGFYVDKVFSVIIDLFVDKQLACCKRSLMNLGVRLNSVPLPRWLAYRLTCESSGTCEGSKTKLWLVWPLPGDDEEYIMPDICLFCRLDLEITWFLVHFRFKVPLGSWQLLLVYSNILYFGPSDGFLKTRATNAICFCLKLLCIWFRVTCMILLMVLFSVYTLNWIWEVVV